MVYYATMTYTVQKLAQLAGVSIRTLHYYDEIGLLKPSHIQENGYRVYEDKELLRLQQILFYRELEFSLEDIKKILDSPSFNMMVALQDHKKLLELKKERIEKVLLTVNATMKHLKGGGIMKNDDLFNGLNDKKMQEYAEEAKQRWGDTDAYKQSAERTRHWTKEDYKKAELDQQAITQEVANLMKAGEPVESYAVQQVIEKHYKYLGRFYDAPYDMYRNLGKMYVDDPRFTAYYDKFAKGLAVFMRDAIAYYCDQHI